MAYVPAMYVAFGLILCDLFFTSIRSTMRSGGDVATYVLLSLHELVGVADAVIIFAFFSYTVWFTAGLLGHLSFTVRVTLPALLLRLALIQMPVIYLKFLSSASRGWDDPVYGVLFCLDIASCIFLSGCMLFTVACLSEKRMYAPYHLQWKLPTGISGRGPGVGVHVGQSVVQRQPGASVAFTGGAAGGFAGAANTALISPQLLYPQMPSSMHHNPTSMAAPTISVSS